MMLFMKRNLRVLLVIACVLVIAGVPHAYNMLEYPYYESDEGTYMAQAWSFVTRGELAPYTYWYDHAPVGWIILGLWTQLTAGFNTFGFSINSGRVLMLLLHLLSSLLLVGINWKIFRSYIPGIITVLIFSFSPLGIYFQRRVLLDNIMVFWLLLSVYLILGERRQLVHYVVSAIAFGMAFLSKESAVYFLPVMMVLVVISFIKYRSLFPVMIWAVLAVMVISYYPLYALLQGEFFPAGHPLGGTHEHVSLLETARYQASRAGGYFLDYESDFMHSLRGWLGEFRFLYADPVLIRAGLAATVFVTLAAIFSRRLLPIVLLTLAYWWFLVRGGVVLEFYVVPLVPLLALAIAASIYSIVDVVRRYVRQPAALTVFSEVFFVVLSVPFVREYSGRQEIYTRNHTRDQIEAVHWIMNNIQPGSFVLIDMYAYIELTNTVGKSHYYWKADRDPEIRDAILNNNWCNIDYILATPQLISDARTAYLEVTGTAYNNSDILELYPGDGWQIEVRKVNKETCSSEVAQLNEDG